MTIGQQIFLNTQVAQSLIDENFRDFDRIKAQRWRWLRNRKLLRLCKQRGDMADEIIQDNQLLLSRLRQQAA